jgi:hypothetical protein
MSATVSSTPNSAASDSNSIDFMIAQYMNKVWTSTLVVVKSVTNAGALSPVGYVSVQPLVGMIDIEGKVYDHGEISNAPYFRLQGGTDAIILDPKVGDIGIALFASRDITAVKKAKKPSPPGSDRKHHISDALYIGGVLNGSPTQYVRFSADGIEIVSPTKFTAKAPSIILDGEVTQQGGNASFGANVSIAGDLGVTGDTNVTGEITGKGKVLSTHVHSGVQHGTDETGAPV